MNISKLNSIILKSQGVEFVVDIDGKHHVDQYVHNDNFLSMMTYVSNCLSNIISQGYIVPFEVFKRTEQETGYDVEIVQRSDFENYPVNLAVTPGMYVPIGTYISDKMGIIRGNEIDFTNLSVLFRDLVKVVEPGQSVPVNPFMLMIISSKCPEFMKGIFPAFGISPFPSQEIAEDNLQQENGFVKDGSDEFEENPFLSDSNRNYDNSDVLGL